MIYENNDKINFMNTENNFKNDFIMKFIVGGTHQSLILSYNYQKGFHSFPFFDTNNLPSFENAAINGFSDNSVIFLKNSYQKFLDDYLLPFYENFDMNKMSEYLGLNKKFIICSYRTEEELYIINELTKEFVRSEYYKGHNHILYVNINEYENNKDKYDGKMGEDGFYSFLADEGIYFTQKEFQNILRIKKTIDYTSLYTMEQLVLLISSKDQRKKLISKENDIPDQEFNPDESPDDDNTPDERQGHFLGDDGDGDMNQDGGDQSDEG